MNLYRSFAFKNSILYLLVFFFSFGVFGFLMFKNSSIRIIETANKELQHRGDLLKIRTIEYYKELVSSLNYLSFNPILENYLNNKSKENYDLLSENYLSLLKANVDFAQIRYIDARTGMEIVRVERDSLGKAKINVADLQNKIDRPYFIKALNLSHEELFISPIDLNREYGKISKPITPTLRMAKLVYKSDQSQGVVVININLKTLFANLNQTVGTQFSMQLLNEDGFYLLHDNPDSTFLFEYTKVNRENDQTKIDNLAETRKLKKSQLVHNCTVQDELIPYKLVFNVIADKENLLSSYFEWRRKSVMILLLTIAFLTMISFLLMNKQTKTFAKITNTFRDFPKNRYPENELVMRTDEIGEMAKGFNEMAMIINSQIDEINSQKLKAEQAFKDKSEFIENISHEIRNPLQSIIGLSSMLEINNPNPNQIDIINSLKFNTINLHGLVNNVLDYQNVLHGEISVERKWSDVAKIIEEVVNGYKYAASEKRVLLSLELDKNLSLYQYKVDGIRLSQILGNLLSNAIKYSNEGGKVKVICYGKKYSNFQELTFSVVDNGVGIAASEITKIKDRYFSNRGIQSLKSSYGIGLTIVSEMLQLFHSKLEINSKEGKGSDFNFKINLESRESKIAYVKQSRLVSLIGFKLLIIEDDNQITNLYLHLLSKSNATIICRDDVVNLKDLEDKFDLIIADYRFSRKSLIDVQDVLTKLKNSKTPLIIASASKPDLAAFQRLFSDVLFIRKPFTNSDFTQIINKSVVIYEFGFPDIDRIMADYDYDPKKFNNALDILFDEWKSITGKLCIAIEKDDKLAFESTLHKFVTTLKRLELSRLSEWLNEVKDGIPISSNSKDETKIKVETVLDTIFQMLKEQV